MEIHTEEIILDKNKNSFIEFKRRPRKPLTESVTKETILGKTKPLPSKLNGMAIINSHGLSIQQIETQLAEIGVPYIHISWRDEFLIAENLQNYFAEVIAIFGHIKRRQGIDNNSLEERKHRWINLNRSYAFLKLSEKQQLIIDLMKEYKHLQTLI